MAAHLVLCEGAVAPPTPEGGWAKLLEVQHRGPAANLTLKVQELAHALNITVARRGMDLVRIAAYAAWADQMVSRGGDTDVTGKGWPRHFHLGIPVQDLALWSAPAVQWALRDTLQLASDDVWEFSFSQAHFDEQLRLGDAPGVDPVHMPSDADCVLLFSGGADSGAAAVEAVAIEGKRPLLVSHRSATVADHRRDRLLGELRRLNPGWSFPHTGVVVKRQQSPEADRSQRTRPFLFASLGAAIAASLAIHDVRLCDNGVVSLNLPINGQLIGAKASRSTHPKVIAAFNRLAALVFPGGPQVQNTLATRTKAEVLAVLRQTGQEALLGYTWSCSHIHASSNATPHCGVCSQCVDRRFASLAAGMEAYDPSEQYAVDIFTHELRGDAITVAEGYVSFAMELEPLDDEAVVAAREELVQALPGDATAEALLRQYVDLVHRHAGTVLRVMQDQMALHAGAALRRLLPPTCLVVLASRPRELRTPALVLGLPLVVLSAREQAEQRRWRFQSDLPMYLSGELDSRARNVVQVGDHELYLADAVFATLLYLVIALYEHEGGWLPAPVIGRKALEPTCWEADDVCTDPMVVRRISDLRAALRPGLGRRDPMTVVETVRHQVRLSTHRRYVKFDRKHLLAHRASQVAKLAKRLPRTSPNNLALDVVLGLKPAS